MKAEQAICIKIGIIPDIERIACFAFFEYIQDYGKIKDENSIREIEEMFFEEAEPHFRYIWDSFSSDDKQVCQAIKAGEEIDEEEEIILFDLIRRGYILPKDNKYELFSETFARRIVPLDARKRSPIDDDSMIRNHSVVFPTEESIRGLEEELERKKPKFDTFVGRCEEMEKVYNQIKMVAPFNTPVFIKGETGTGKELVAKAIHSLSGRNRLEAINCATIPKELTESLLFGHERGAFTGADRRREGKFMIADGGTLFLDEIGEMDTEIQAKFLRVLETKTFQRVGGQEQIKVDVRIIVATNRDLEKAIKEGNFREELYYRLNNFEITLPPLRERGDDILLLALYFLREFAKEHPSIKAKSISPQVAKALLEYQWQGNVRELKGVIEHAAIASKRLKLMPEDLRDISGFDPWSDFIEIQIRSLDRIKSEVAHLRYQSEEKNYKKAAESLGISERTLKSWLNRTTKSDRTEIDVPKVSAAQYSSWEDIEREVIKRTLEYTENNNPKAANILSIALSTFLKKLRKYKL